MLTWSWPSWTMLTWSCSSCCFTWPLLFIGLFLRVVSISVSRGKTKTMFGNFTPGSCSEGKVSPCMEIWVYYWYPKKRIIVVISFTWFLLKFPLWLGMVDMLFCLLFSCFSWPWWCPGGVLAISLSLGRVSTTSSTLLTVNSLILTVSLCVQLCCSVW